MGLWVISELVGTSLAFNDILVLFSMFLVFSVSLAPIVECLIVIWIGNSSRAN